MCSIIILRRPGHAWPLVVAANRDEMLDRSWDAPDRHWPDRPEVIAGRDRLAGGSWFGRNDHSVFAAILNREGSLGPSADKRSRGELVLEALDHPDAAAAADALADLDANAYRSFNLVVGDNTDVFHLANRARANSITIEEVMPGLSMLTSQEINDRRNARIGLYLPQFESADVPDPELDDWTAWRRILSDNTSDPAVGPSSAMCIVSDCGFGTVSSTLLAFPAAGSDNPAGIYMFAPGRPDQADYAPV
ncbi:MAG: NRDE family protein [Pseudomonadota bacterium]|nr:NRDE family protein [Pseudomonadota bacterium]